MLQLISLVFIYGGMMFIWTFVYLNRSHDKINQAFLVFLSNILAWMVLNNLGEYGDRTTIGLAVKTVYWLSMMYLSITFLFFIYRLLKRKTDWLFWLCLGLNTLTVIVRYLYPIDYNDPAFWRMDDPVVAPLMSISFSLPAIYALYLVFRQIISTKDARLRAQLGFVLSGIGLALVVSVLSEYILPVVFHVKDELYLMYYAIAVFVFAIFISIMRYRLMNIRSDYIYRNLFLNASEGILIVNRSGRIVSVNRIGREILLDENLDAGDDVASYLPEYRFDAEYRRYETEVTLCGQTRYLSLTQYPMEEQGRDTSKLLLLADLTQSRLREMSEKEKLLEKSTVDQLTGLYNKQYLREKYKGNENGAQIRKSLLFIDVDDFKSINDNYGHLVGDEVLRELAACIKANVRVANDSIRFGGDEFVIILEETGQEDAYLVAERIRSCACGLAFNGANGAFHITLSIGLIEGTGSLDELIDKADRAMYSSKTQGKNKTTFYTHDEDGAFHMKVSQREQENI